MRKPLILAAILAAVPLSQVLAQPRATRVQPPATRAQPPATRAQPPATASRAQFLSAEQRTQLQQIVSRGRALAVLDQAARVTTRDMLARVPNPQEAGIVGWIAQVEGNGVAVTYFSRAGEGFATVYRSQVLGGRITSPQVFAAGSRPALTGDAARMAAARVAAGAVERTPCGPEFNAVVLPPQGDGPVLVYRLSPRVAADKLPGGGHHRFAIAPDGSVASETSLGAATCTDIALPPVAAGTRPRPLQIIATGSDLPNELHVFTSIVAQRPVVVATGTTPTRLWGVTGEGIGELQQ